jgi:hypothetical protein
MAITMRATQSDTYDKVLGRLKAMIKKNIFTLLPKIIFLS